MAHYGRERRSACSAAAAAEYRQRSVILTDKCGIEEAFIPSPTQVSSFKDKPVMPDTHTQVTTALHLSLRRLVKGDNEGEVPQWAPKARV